MATEELTEVLSEFARTMVTLPVERILDHLVERIVEITPVTAAGATLILQGSEPSYIAASSGSALRYEQLQAELDEGPSPAAYQTQEAILVPDLSNEERFPLFSFRAQDAGLGAVFAFPLRHEDLLVGALSLYLETPGALSPESMSGAQTLADVAAAYVLNAQARAELESSRDQSRDAALHDPLTGLANRVLMLERLDHAFLRCQRSGKTLAVFFVDLDNFKPVNDRYGHRVGDELLVDVAKRLAGVVRPDDSLARLSGDEFVILCEDLDDPSQADAIALRIDEEIARPFALSLAEVSITASIGIAFADQSDAAPEDSIDSADLAMYRIKRRKRGVDKGHDVRKAHLSEHRLGLSDSLQGAAARGELHLEYLPIVGTVDGRLTGVEALLRWKHPTRGEVSPMVFIPLAEQSGHMIEIGQWVLEQAWRDQHHWQRHRTEKISLSVNVSAHEFMSAGFVATVASLLDSAPADPGLLTLEMTESALIRDRERAVIVLDELKDLGIKLALDDFGSGYSSLSYLRTIPIDTIKIDRGFIANLGVDPSNDTIVTAIIQLAHGLGMTVLSEGVETAEQRRELVELGCDACQGFYFARPAPAESVDALIEGWVGGAGGGLPVLPFQT